MPVSFFITDLGEFYASLEPDSINQETYEWLGQRQIEMGRKSSFNVAKESPVFQDLGAAEKWLKQNWLADRPDIVAVESDDVSIDPQQGPTQEDYKSCARLAHEMLEIAGIDRLAKILPFEQDHAYLCSIGVWYWQLGHRMLAEMAYLRSIEIELDPITFFNLGICHDDMGRHDDAKASISRYFELIPESERQKGEELLRQNGKAHLINSE